MLRFPHIFCVVSVTKKEALPVQMSTQEACAHLRHGVGLFVHLTVRLCEAGKLPGAGFICCKVSAM